ncbi:hypothetical protein O1L60_15445 [Streptomyces diastatochromogenes]|nr:hypothetical protein [Streptomyces diastatochromogenes]
MPAQLQRRGERLREQAVVVHHHEAYAHPGHPPPPGPPDAPAA